MRKQKGKDLGAFGAPPATRVDTWSLPRGRFANADPDDVAAAQRARALYAIVDAVAAKGYAQTTLTDIVDRARISRNAFYVHFTDKEACFLSAYEAAHYALIEQVIKCQHDGMSWHQRLRASLHAYLTFKKANPTLAQTMLVDIHAAGVNARKKRDWGHQRFADMQSRLYALRRQSQPELPKLSPLTFLAMVAAVEEMAAAYVLSGRLHRVLEVEAPALYMLEAVYGGPER